MLLRCHSIIIHSSLCRLPHSATAAYYRFFQCQCIVHSGLALRNQSLSLYIYILGYTLCASTQITIYIFLGYIYLIQALHLYIWVIYIYVFSLHLTVSMHYAFYIYLFGMF